MAMSGCPRGGDCGSCLSLGGPVVCHCLGVTEEQLASALAAFELRTLKEVRRQTGAGTGCNACHKRLQCYIAEYAPPSE